MKQIIKHAFIETLPVMAGYLVLGIGFGIIVEKSGYGVIWAMQCMLFIVSKIIYIPIFLLDYQKLSQAQLFPITCLEEEYFT